MSVDNTDISIPQLNPLSVVVASVKLLANWLVSVSVRSLLLFWRVIFTDSRMSTEHNISAQLRTGRYRIGMYQRRPVCGKEICWLSNFWAFPNTNEAWDPISSTHTLTLCNSRTLMHKNLTTVWDGTGRRNWLSFFTDKISIIHCDLDADCNIDLLEDPVKIYKF